MGAVDVVLVLLAVALLATLGRRWLPAPVALIVLAVVWIFVDHPVEGPVLWTLDPAHGLTVADLLSPAVTLVALARIWLLQRSRRRPAPAVITPAVIHSAAAAPTRATRPVPADS